MRKLLSKEKASGDTLVKLFKKTYISVSILWYAMASRQLVRILIPILVSFLFSRFSLHGSLGFENALWNRCHRANKCFCVFNLYYECPVLPRPPLRPSP